VQETEPLGPEIGAQRAHPGCVTSGLVQARDQSCLHWVWAGKYDRDSRGCAFGGECRARASSRDDNFNPAPNEIGCQLCKSIVLTLGRAVFDRDVLALGIASFLPALTECGHQVHGAFNRRTPKEPDHRHRRLLRARGKRPRCHCAA
jgi:hypothetical protein